MSEHRALRRTRVRTVAGAARRARLTNENAAPPAAFGHGVPPRARANSLHLDSLQDLLEREGYQETRIVSPLMEKRGAPNAPESPCAPRGKGAGAPPAQEDASHTAPCTAAKAQGPVRRPRRRRSQIWDGSIAYRDSAPHEPMPRDALQRIAAVQAPLAAPPAAPVLSLEDAVAPPEPQPPRTLRRSKSEDLLAKTLRGTERIRCACGLTTPTHGVAARWHAAACPVREHWAAHTSEDVPPPPPALTVSTPRGVSAPQHLDLCGAEYEPRSPRTRGLRGLFARTSRLTLMRRATTAGLSALFRADAQPNPLLRRAETRGRGPERGRPAAGAGGGGDAPPSAPPPAGASPPPSGSTQIHALRACVEARIRSGDATFVDAREFPTLARFAAASGSAELDADDSADLFESPTVQRALTRTQRLARPSMPALRAPPPAPLRIRRAHSRVVIPRVQPAATSLGLGASLGADDSLAAVLARRACAPRHDMPAMPLY